jgi:hypothetical protein
MRHGPRKSHATGKRVRLHVLKQRNIYLFFKKTLFLNFISQLFCAMDTLIAAVHDKQFAVSYFKLGSHKKYYVNCLFSDYVMHLVATKIV